MMIAWMREGTDMVELRIMNADPVFDYRQSCGITLGMRRPKPLNIKNEEDFWLKHILANHSTMRSIRFRIIDEAKKTVIAQLVRATKGHPQPYAEASRPDWTGKERSSDPYEEKLFGHDHTAESFIEMAKQRLCSKAEKNTRLEMIEIVDAMKSHPEPYFRALAKLCMPYCEWYGGRCPELYGCGKCKSFYDSIKEKENENCTEQ